MQPIVEMVHNNDKEALDKLNQYNVQNAWFKVILEDVLMAYSVLPAR